MFVENFNTTTMETQKKFSEQEALQLIEQTYPYQDFEQTTLI